MPHQRVGKGPQRLFDSLPWQLWVLSFRVKALQGWAAPSTALGHACQEAAAEEAAAPSLRLPAHPSLLSLRQELAPRIPASQWTPASPRHVHHAHFWDSGLTPHPKRTLPTAARHPRGAPLSLGRCASQAQARKGEEAEHTDP